MSVHDLSTTGGRWLHSEWKCPWILFWSQTSHLWCGLPRPLGVCTTQQLHPQMEALWSAPRHQGTQGRSCTEKRQWSTAGRAERAADPTQLGQLGAGVLWSVSSTPLGQEQPGAEGLWLWEQLWCRAPGGDGSYLERQSGGQSLRERGGESGTQGCFKHRPAGPKTHSSPRGRDRNSQRSEDAAAGGLSANWLWVIKESKGLPDILPDSSCCFS